MTAIALDLSQLHPTTHKALYTVIAKERSPLAAEILVGSPEPTGDNPFEQARESLDHQSCISCGCHVTDALECLYEYDDGEPAFYLCLDCESDYLTKLNSE